MKKLFESIIEDKNNRKDRALSFTAPTTAPTTTAKKNFRHTMAEKKEEQRKASLD